MSGKKLSSVDADHEIQEFLQECIVEKINNNNDGQTTEIKSELVKLGDNVKSVKSSTGTIDMNVSGLLQQVKDLGDLAAELEQKSDSIIKLEREIRTNLQNNETITNSIVDELNGLEKDSIDPIKEDLGKCRAEVLRLNDVLEELSQLNDLLNKVNDTTKNNYQKQCEDYSSLSEKHKSTMEMMERRFESLDEKNNNTNSQLSDIQSSEQNLSNSISEISQTVKRVWVVSLLNIIIVLIILVLHIT